MGSHTQRERQGLGQCHKRNASTANMETNMKQESRRSAKNESTDQRDDEAGRHNHHRGPLEVEIDLRIQGSKDAMSAKANRAGKRLRGASKINPNTAQATSRRKRSHAVNRTWAVDNGSP